MSTSCHRVSAGLYKPEPEVRRGRVSRRPGPNGSGSGQAATESRAVAGHTMSGSSAQPYAVKEVPARNQLAVLQTQISGPWRMVAFGPSTAFAVDVQPLRGRSSPSRSCAASSAM